MMKWGVILVGAILLTGCSQNALIEETNSFMLAPKTIEFCKVDTEKVAPLKARWAELEEAFSAEHEGDRNGIAFYNRGNKAGDVITMEDFYWVRNIESNQGQRAIEVLEETLGTSLESFLSGKEFILAGETREMVIDGVGLILYNDGEYYRLYVGISGLYLVDKEQQAFVEEVMGDALLLSAASQGEGGSIIELAAPSFRVRRNIGSLWTTTCYYQLINDASGTLNKARLVINQMVDKEPIESISPDKLEALVPIIRQLNGGEAADLTGLLQDINDAVNAVNNNKVSIKGKVGGLNYSISRMNSDIGYEKLVEVVIQ